MKPKYRVYVAGKLNDMAVDYIHNCHKMMVQAEEVKKRGFSVFVPCMDFLQGLMFGYKSYEDYFDYGQLWLDASHAVFLTEGWESSSGTRREIKRAREQGIPVFDNLDNMVEWFKQQDNILERKANPDVNLTFQDTVEVMETVQVPE